MSDDLYTKPPEENGPIEAAAEELFSRQPFYAELKEGKYSYCTRNLARMLTAIETAVYTGLDDARCHLTFELVLRYSKQITCLIQAKSDLVAVEHSLQVYGFFDTVDICKNNKYRKGPAYEAGASNLEELCFRWAGWARNDTSFHYVRQKLPIEKWSVNSLCAFLKHRSLREFEEIYPTVDALLNNEDLIWPPLDESLMHAAIEDSAQTGRADKVKFLVDKKIHFSRYHIEKILNEGLIPILEFMHENKIDIPNNDSSLPSLETLKWLHEHKYDIIHRIIIPCITIPLVPGAEQKLEYALEQKLPIHQEILFVTINDDRIMLIILQDRVRIGIGIPSFAIRRIRSHPAKFPNSLKYAHDWATSPACPKDSSWDWPIPHYAGVHNWC